MHDHISWKLEKGPVNRWNRDLREKPEQVCGTGGSISPRQRGEKGTLWVISFFLYRVAYSHSLLLWKAPEQSWLSDKNGKASGIHLAGAHGLHLQPWRLEPPFAFCATLFLPRTLLSFWFFFGRNGLNGIPEPHFRTLKTKQHSRTFVFGKTHYRQTDEVGQTI